MNDVIIDFMASFQNSAATKANAAVTTVTICFFIAAFAEGLPNLPYIDTTTFLFRGILVSPMFEKKMPDEEKRRFLLISLPSLKGRASEEIKGRLLYALKSGKLSDEDLKAAFPEEYAAVLGSMKKRSFLSFAADKKNHTFDYYLGKHNATAGCKVVPAQIIGMRAERKDGKNAVVAKVRYRDGASENLSINLFENFDMRINLRDHVLVHNNTICYKLSNEDYENVMRDYFPAEKGGRANGSATQKGA